MFLGNFTPKTSNYCIKNRPLGFLGTYKWDVLGLITHRADHPWSGNFRPGTSSRIVGFRIPKLDPLPPPSLSVSL